MEVVSVEVAHLEAALMSFASDPQDSTPEAEALTSQEAEFRFETMSEVDEASPVTTRPFAVLVAEVKRVVDEAIPEKVKLVPEIAVVEAYGKVEAVEVVAVRYAATI